MTLFGPDVSSYQRGLQLAAGTPFVAAKATEGTGWTDDTYTDFKAQAARIGAIFWAYHFLDEGNAPAQAEHAHAVVGDTPLMLDWEGVKDDQGNYTSRPSVQDAIGFIDTYRRLGGRIWSTYLPPWYWSDPKGLGSPPLAPITGRGLALISSHYTAYSDTGPGWAAYGGAQPQLWQYTDSQPYGGRPVDFNAYRGTPAQLAALVAGQQPTTAASAAQMMPANRENDMHVDLQLNKPVVFTNPAAVLGDTSYLLLAGDFGDATVRIATFSLKSGTWSVLPPATIARTAGAYKLALPPDTNKISVEMTGGSGAVGLDVLA